MNASAINKFNYYAKNDPKTIAVCISNVIKTELFNYFQENNEVSTCNDGHYFDDINWCQLHRIFNDCSKKQEFNKFIPILNDIFSSYEEHAFYNIIIFNNGESGIIINDLYEICGMDILIISTSAIAKKIYQL